MGFTPLGYNFKFCSYRLGHQVQQLGLLPLAPGCDDHRQSARLPPSLSGQSLLKLINNSSSLNKGNRGVTVFGYLIEVRQKYSAAHRILNSLLGVRKCRQTESFVFDIKVSYPRTQHSYPGRAQA